ncbi:helix-turn-helix domain-containing protein [Nocardia amikacinitolerans]|uniref:helix-turn-helix domain-containing protein n=1 Tax=Nocardia amikacinitolerans TaxID=756689 RepID=UPI0008319CAA|nr:helix-turn-helix domain-containing protein [Nocardia amikacinitolerans]MCP2290666.1 Helix-turn-helix domain-containing protein [Nocardia amikacinitolerans]MCP2318286.1 Helix-turn-helix domain-containing protein [Nocardia amikacinitolerans]
MARPRPRRRERDTSGPLADFGGFIAARRRTLELTQLDVADLADVGVSSVRNLEAGRTSPTLAVALRILDALGLTLVSMPHTDARTLTGTTVELRASKPGNDD